jgi:hypothetical protein
MGAVERDERSKDQSIQPGVPEGGRSPTGGDPGGAATSTVTALEPGQRWTLARKREVVLRLLRGESIEVLSRELGIESYRLQEWYEGALAGLDCGLRERGGDPLEDQLKKAHAMVGELTMMNELYQERIRRNENRPFAPKRSRK